MISLVPWTINGSNPFDELKLIPIFSKGLITLFIGLFLNELSPVRVAKISLPPIAPISILANVPLLPQSICLLGILKPVNPEPLTIYVLLFFVIFTPNTLRAFTIFKTSSEFKRFEISLFPTAKAENKRALCDIDLSAGGSIIPYKFLDL